MSTTTPNFDLIKPELTDPADITAINGNWDKIDTELKELRQAVEISSGNLDTYTEVGMYVYSASNSTSITNTPEKAQSTMLVLPRLMKDSPANRVQLVITQTNHLYMRHLAENTWDGWTRLRNADEVIPVVYGGTGATTVSETRNVFNLPETCVLTEDWNTATKTGWYMSNGDNKNAPSAAWYFGFVIAHNDQYVLQEVYAFTNSSGKATDLTKYIRSCYAGTWTPWTNVTVQRTVPEGAQLDYIKTLSSDAQAQINTLKNNKMDSKPAFVELTPVESANHGGYIDFHYAGSADDFTSRLIEEQAGVLLARAQFKAEGNLYENANSRVYSEQNPPTAAKVGAVACTTPMTLSVNANGGLTITY